MAEGKKGFILYTDLIHTINKLSDVRAGKLFKHVLAYVNDENPKTDDQIIELVFEPIKQQLKRDLKHWESVRKKRSDAGKASANKRKQNKQVLTSVNKRQQSSTNLTVIVNDNVKDIVKEINYRDELLQYFQYLTDEHDRSIGHMQVEQTLKMLDSWYKTDDQKKQCLSYNIANNWKTLNHVDVKQNKSKLKIPL